MQVINQSQQTDRFAKLDPAVKREVIEMEQRRQEQEAAPANRPRRVGAAVTAAIIRLLGRA